MGPGEGRAADVERSGRQGAGGGQGGEDAVLQIDQVCFSDVEIGDLINIAAAIEAGIEPEDVGINPTAQAVAAAAAIENVIAEVADQADGRGVAGSWPITSSGGS